MVSGWKKGLYYLTVHPANGEQLLSSTKKKEFIYKELALFRTVYESINRLGRSVKRGQIGTLNLDILVGDHVVLDGVDYVVVGASTKPNPARPGQELNYLDIEG